MRDAALRNLTAHLDARLGELSAQVALLQAQQALQNVFLHLPHRVRRSRNLNLFLHVVHRRAAEAEVITAEAGRSGGGGRWCCNHTPDSVQLASLCL